MHVYIYVCAHTFHYVQKFSLPFFTVKEYGLFIWRIFSWLSARNTKFEAKLTNNIRARKTVFFMFGKFNIFLPKSQNTRLPFTRISVQIVCSSEVPYFRITGSF